MRQPPPTRGAGVHARYAPLSTASSHGSTSAGANSNQAGFRRKSGCGTAPDSPASTRRSVDAAATSCAEGQGVGPRGCRKLCTWRRGGVRSPPSSNLTSVCGVRARVCVCACACVSVGVRVRVCACECTRVCVRKSAHLRRGRRPAKDGCHKPQGDHSGVRPAIARRRVCAPLGNGKPPRAFKCVLNQATRAADPNEIERWWQAT
jgi:hypothetical protein